MPNVIEDLLTFVETRNIPPQFDNIARLYGAGSARTMAISILEWLKRQRRFRHEKPELTRKFTWCQCLSDVFEEWAELAGEFEITDDGFNFRASVSASDRNAMRELADARYRPEKMR